MCIRDRDLKELYAYRQMIFSLVKKDLRGRYKGSVLGFMWTFINPLLQMGVYTLVFSIILRNDIDKYYLFLFVALVPWIFFSASLTGGADSVLASKDMLKKIYFPREVLPISYVTGAFVNMLLSFVVIFGVIIFTGHGLNPVSYTHLDVYKRQYIWYEYYSRVIFMPFFRRGNWAVVGMYVLILFFFTRVMGGYKVGYLRISDICLSQLLAILASNVIGYLQICMIGRDYMPIGPIIMITWAEILFVVPWAYTVRWLFVRLYPPCLLYTSQFSDGLCELYRDGIPEDRP